jgi:hypothetical protein
VAVLLLAAVAIAAEPRKDATPAKDARADYGLIFCYDDMMEPKEFLQSTPCVTGVSWRCTKEDDKFWYGDLHYPTENTANYALGAKDRSDQYYMVTNVAIKKQEGLPIDPAKFEGALVLRDPAPETPLAMRGDGTSYELVGYEGKALAEEAERPFNFLFANNKELKFVWKRAKQIDKP